MDLSGQSYHYLQEGYEFSFFAHLNGKTLFSDFGKLFTTDGSIGKTLPVSNIYVDGPRHVYFDSAEKKEYVVFQGSRANNGSISGAGSHILFISEGDVTSTVEVGRMSDGFWDLNGELYYFDHLNRICRFDKNTRQSITITPIVIYNFNRSDIGYAGKLNNNLLFIGKDSVFGIELWAFNGKEIRLLKDVHKGPADAHPYVYSTTANNRRIFSAYDGVTTLYSTDGTDTGTESLQLPIWTDSCNWTNFITSDFFKYKNEFVFLINNCRGVGLWLSDGTLKGTREIFKLKDKISNEYFRILDTELDDKLLFIGWSKTSGYELWTMNWADKTCSPLIDINTIPENGSNPRLLLKHNNKVYFLATDSAHGREIWATDGTKPGTKMIADCLPGTLSGIDQLPYPDLYVFREYISFYMRRPATDSLNNFWIYNTLKDTAYQLNEVSQFSINKRYNVVYRADSILIIQGFDDNNRSVLWKTDYAKSFWTKLENNCTYTPEGKLWGAKDYNGKVYMIANGNTLWAYTSDAPCQDTMKNLEAILRPNPTTTDLEVRFENNIPKSASLSVLDISGKETNIVYSRFLDYGWNIDCSNLKPGIYFLTIRTKTTYTTQKFVKI